jgi:hypothetical protein
MKSARLVFFCAAVCVHAVCAGAVIGLAQKAPPKPTPARTPAAPKPAVSHAAPTQDLNAVVKRYCVSCHNDSRKLNALSLTSFDVTHAAQSAEVAEKMIVKLRRRLHAAAAGRAAGCRDPARAGHRARNRD